MRRFGARVLDQLRLLQPFVHGALGWQLLQLKQHTRGVMLCACLATSFASVACHSATQLTNETAPRTKLATYSSAVLEVVAEPLSADARADLAHELEAQLSDSKLFARLSRHASRGTADATLRVTLLNMVRRDDVTVRFRVELLEPKRAVPLVARFDVEADSSRAGIREGAGAAYDFDDKPEHALEKGLRAIVLRLESYSSSGDLP